MNTQNFPPPSGGPAYPTYPKGFSQGMTLRDYFAGQAMQGFAANRTYSELSDAQLAKASYLMADAMLEARK
jgi:hypothetical protein